VVAAATSSIAVGQRVMVLPLSIGVAPVARLAPQAALP
jgi:hypothetical protein